MRTVAIVQARMGSTRLPGKTMMPLAGEPMLARVVERSRRARRVDAVVVATTTSPQDDTIASLCRERGWPCERGSEEDVLDRYRAAARAHRADVVVRITSDCPVIDPGIVDALLEAFSRGTWDYASNGLEPRTYPRGLDVEAFTLAALERAWHEDENPEWREHVTAYIQRHPELFRILRYDNDRDLSRHRWTVDTPEDYELMRRIYDHFRGAAFGWTDVLRLLESHPDWVALNRAVKQKTVR